MYRKILLAVDIVHEGSWRKSLPTAVEYAQTFGSELHLVTVLPDFGMSIVGSYFSKDFEADALEDTREKLTAFMDENVPEGVAATAHVAHGRSYEEILAAAEKLEADLIVVASHQPGTEDYLLGSTAARVVRFAKASVLVVRD